MKLNWGKNLGRCSFAEARKFMLMLSRNARIFTLRS